MMKKLLFGLLGLAAIPAAWGTDAGYTNNIVFIAPPQIPPNIDAYNFVNNATFVVNSGFTVPYEMANTTNVINRAVLGSATGFRFDKYVRSANRHEMAANFLNTEFGTITCGASSTNYLVSLASQTQCNVWASNIVNRGSVNVGLDGLIRFQGQRLDLTSGRLNIEGFATNELITAGQFDSHWGLGAMAFNPSQRFAGGFVNLPDYWITNRDYTWYKWNIYPLTTKTYGLAYYPNPQDTSNVVVEVAFVSSPDTFDTQVFMWDRAMTVQWGWIATNAITGEPYQDYLAVDDDFLVHTNLLLMRNGTAGPSTGYRPTYVPTNYYVYRGYANTGFPAQETDVSTYLDYVRTNLSVDYSAYEMLFQPTSVLLGELANQSPSNAPGRIELLADRHLALDNVRINALNYLGVRATNTFTANGNTRIATPYADFDLRFTNSGPITVSNLLSPRLPRLLGTVQLWSGRWTYVDRFNITYHYHVLIADNYLETTSPSYVQSLSLRGTNVVISDVFNVSSNLLVDAERVTVTTNAPGSASPSGAIVLPSGLTFWPNAFPRLKWLTNYGILQGDNIIDFRGVRGPPYYPSSFEEPYEAFVNYGQVYDEGSVIWAKYFENGGTFYTGGGSFDLRSQTANLYGGTLNATAGDLSLWANDMALSNVTVNVGRQFVLAPTNSLTDGVRTNPNIWNVTGSFSLLTRPAVGSLLNTAVTNTVAGGMAIINEWSGDDAGCTAAGFNNNLALRALTLDGGSGSSVTFQGSGMANALYVDYLELKNAMTNRNAAGNLTGLTVADNMRIYYGQVMINGISYAEKLDGKHGGRLCWVRDYAGFLSGTNLVYPDGSTNALNIALVTSCNLDSDNDGQVNCIDPTPLIVPSQVHLSAKLTNAPARSVALSWNTFANATNLVSYTGNLPDGPWQVLTNFVSASAGQARLLDPVRSTNRFYRIQIAPRQP